MNTAPVQPGPGLTQSMQMDLIARLIDEGPISTIDVAILAKKNVGTVWRWITAGIVAPNGQRVFLEAMRVGGTYQTSEAAYVRFLEAQLAPAPILMPSQERHRKRRAKPATTAALEAFGV